jgi:glycosyltransferase involved in cell wall biosynthesis
MSVAVVIPNLNYGQFLADALRSALTQTVRPDEIIVVDGESTDNSHDVVRAQGDGIIWMSRLPQGQANARNIGITTARSEFIVPLDADDWIESTYIERCLELITSEVGVVAPSLVWPDGRVARVSPPFTAERFLEGNLLFCCSMFRKQAWEQVGGYDEQRDIYEDWLLWGKIVSCGWKIVALHEPLFHYRPHPNNSTGRMGFGDHGLYCRRTCEKLRCV